MQIHESDPSRNPDEILVIETPLPDVVVARFDPDISIDQRRQTIADYRLETLSALLGKDATQFFNQEDVL